MRARTGELVFTSLTKEAMPVIRYRTRDICSLQPGTARSMRRMGRVAARSDDMLIIRGVNVFPSQFEELVSADPRLTGHFFLEVHERGRMEGITAVLEPKPDATDHETIAQEFASTVRQRIGVAVEVRTVEPEGVPRSEGKAPASPRPPDLSIVGEESRQPPVALSLRRAVRFRSYSGSVPSLRMSRYSVYAKSRLRR